MAQLWTVEETLNENLKAWWIEFLGLRRHWRISLLRKLAICSLQTQTLVLKRQIPTPRSNNFFFLTLAWFSCVQDNYIKSRSLICLLSGYVRKMENTWSHSLTWIPAMNGIKTHKNIWVFPNLNVSQKNIFLENYVFWLEFYSNLVKFH